MDLEHFIDVLVPVLLALLASSGFWMWVLKKTEKKTLQTQLLIGLAHDRIVYLGLVYIKRGWITQDEYENLHTYLYKPYDGLGGNGSAQRIMAEVYKLPIRENTYSKRRNNVVE